MQTRVNGKEREYSPSFLYKLFERLSFATNTELYSRRKGTRLELSPHLAYHGRDIFNYTLIIPQSSEQSLEERMENPLRERIEITLQDFKGNFYIEMDAKKGNIVVKKESSDKSTRHRRVFSNDDYTNIENYVRGLLS